MTFVLHYFNRGPHVVSSLYAGPDREHVAKIGDLIFRNEEWQVFRGMLEGLRYPADWVEVIVEKRPERGA